LYQLEPGTLKGWLFSTKVGSYHVTAGSFNRKLLYEGRFNPNVLHAGFILSPEHSIILNAHEFDSGILDINYGETYMHEVHPANMVWVNIYAPEVIMMEGVKYLKKTLHDHPHLSINGAREELIPMTKLINACINQASNPDNNAHQCSPSHLKKTLHQLHACRFATNLYDQPFIEGDLFRMQMLRKISSISLANQIQPMSLNEICAAINIKSRTLQKYFNEIYGMGPTAYFRIRRLNEARKTLMNGTSGVSETALSWGFSHFGRFSGNYKALFNESPKTTIELSKKGRPS